MQRAWTLYRNMFFHRITLTSCQSGRARKNAPLLTCRNKRPLVFGMFLMNVKRIGLEFGLDEQAVFRRLVEGDYEAKTTNSTRPSVSLPQCCRSRAVCCWKPLSQSPCHIPGRCIFILCSTHDLCGVERSNPAFSSRPDGSSARRGSQRTPGANASLYR